MCERCVEAMRTLHDHQPFGAVEFQAEPAAPPVVNMQITVPPSAVPELPTIHLNPEIHLNGLMEFVQGHLLLVARVEMLEARVGELGM